MRAGLFWLNDRQWACIAPHLPTNLSGPERDDDRRIISGIIHMLQCGARWRDCPPEYGPYTTIYNRFNRWAKRGRWGAIFERLAKPQPALRSAELLMSFSSSSRGSHRHRWHTAELVILGDMVRYGCWLTCGCFHDIC
jgi:transposase